jgi:uncharacterized membrane-anchored protein
VGGLLSHVLYKLYIYFNNREQADDSNLLISLVFILVIAACIYLFLSLMSIFTSSRK